ncbi:MAG: DNA recombination protein RmuC [Patescibacteria group bacterium]|jgi:DNA recombination protein RmuC
MEILLGIILIALCLIIGLMFYFFNKKEVDTGQNERLNLLGQELKEIRQEMKLSIKDSLDFVQKEAGRSAGMIASITEKLTKLDETNRQVVNFADQLQNLQDILKNPKQRGILGEYYLETVLKNVLPPTSYQMQYKFKNGEIVDAVIFVKDKIIPIDSKFSLDNYNKILEERDPARREVLEKLFKQDLKNRVDETAKYVRPNENTMDFAFMFIPSEGIFYDILINQVGAVKLNTRDLIEYAFKERHVIIVSPTSFLAYLQTVLQGLRALQIEEKTQEIIKQVEKLTKHLSNYEVYWSALGKNLGATVNAFNKGQHEFKQIDKDVLKITGAGIELDLAEIEKPKEE